MRTNCEPTTLTAIDREEMTAVDGGLLTVPSLAAGSNIEKLIEQMQRQTPTPIIPILGEFGPTNNTAPVA